MKPSAKTPGVVLPQTAPLLYWLLVVCGLAGLTLQRLDSFFDVAPLWLGAITGVGLGQMIAWARVRVWVLVAMGLIALWVSPVLLFVLYQPIKGPVETMVLAFVPAAICGYLSLSERGGLLSFWFPAVLWMLVILDGPSASAFSAHAAVPFVIGLAALFVAFLRAQETRRAAIWQGYAGVRLAKTKTRAVLRSSPLRAASQHAWTGLVGAGALVFAAWVAPQLWQKDETLSPAGVTTAAQAGTLAANAAAEKVMLENLPCCGTEEKRVRVKEYLPLLHGQSGGRSQAEPMTCTVCPDAPSASAAAYAANAGDGYAAGGYGGPYASGYSGPYNGGGGSSYAGGGLGGGGNGGTTYGGYDNGTTNGGGYNGGYVAPYVPPPVEPVVQAPIVPTTAATVPAVVPHAANVPATPHVSGVTPNVPKAGAHPALGGPALTSGQPLPIQVEASAAPSASVPTPPWESMLALCLGGMGLHVLLRALRRKLTLRHLSRPFWREQLDQRISNHWQRMLIGLRDAGIQPTEDEQPLALAKRVGIDGMETCATILERVRHGVRVDDGDLDAMDAAAAAVYHTARVKAGVTGRAAGWLRSPL